jgi:hypothetical protein
MTRTFITSFSIALVALALGAGTANAAGKNGFFKTQDGSIYCGWGYGGGTSGFVVCGLKKGFLKPKPKNNCKHIDYVGNRIGFTDKGKAKIEPCAGDAGPFANPKATKVLAAGKTWKGGGMSCTTTTSTVTCKNKVKHGFTMTKPGPYKLF